MTKKTKMIEIRRLNKSFGTKQILHDINLSIGKTEAACIIRPSGSGKSTFLSDVRRNRRARSPKCAGISASSSKGSISGRTLRRWKT